MHNQILKNTGSLMAFQVAKMLFPFITLPYLTRVLSTDSYGVVAYVKTVMNYMQVIVDFGFVLSATKSVVMARDDSERLARIVGDTLLARVLLGVAAFGVLCLMMLFLSILRAYVLYTVLSYVVVFLSVFLLDYLFRGLETMHIITFRFVLMKTVATLLTFVFVRSDADVLLIPLFDILGSVLAVLLVAWEVRKLRLRLAFTGLRKAWRAIRESFIYFLSNAASLSFNVLSTIIIGAYVSTTEIAYWSVCMQVITSVTACYSPIADGIYPEMIKSRNVQLVRRLVRTFLPLVCAGSVACYVLAGFILGVLGGEPYVVAVPVFRMLVPVLVFGFLAVILGWPLLGAIGRSGEVTATTVLSLGVHVLLLVALIVADAMTLMNIAIVRCLTEAVLFASRYCYFRRFRTMFAG